ncbi:DUF2268 domain-containing putative Zn-dependent protease [Lysinibacillus sp. FSL W8-0992]|uniref:DUF2268 domain-containing putative Zn-dependent protease n=1 Tax=Lysinibacillus sp. FSL W8-0992 TaxID=2954643 RepID=UPI0030F7DA20
MIKLPKIITAFILICTILTLASCTQTEKSHKKQEIESIVTSFEHPQTKQKYKIINAYKLYDNYQDKVESNPKQSKQEIYKDEVIEPIYSDCFDNGEYLHMAHYALNVAPDQLTENQLLSKKINREETEKLIKEALFKSSDLIPSEKETNVCVFPATNVYAYMVTVGAGKIIVLYNKNYTEEDMRISISHEYHHSIWTEKYLPKDARFTILDNMVFEGKAVMFSKLVYPNDYYDNILYSAYDRENWSKVVGDLDSPDFKRSQEIIFGGDDLPSSYGYSEGYKMVKSYLKLHPDVTPEEWTALSAKEIFEKGNYLEHYQ